MDRKIKFILIITGIILVLFLGIIFYLKIQKSENKPIDSGHKNQEDKVLMEYFSFHGPCPPGRICEQKIKLYYSGKIVYEGQENKTENLGKSKINQIIEKIRATNLMNKDCSSQDIIMDYTAVHKFNFNNKTKEIQFPGCEEEIKEIEGIIFPANE